MVKGIIGKKVGMTQLFDENGKVIPSPSSRLVPAPSCRRRPSRAMATGCSAGLRRGFRQEGQQGSCRSLQEGKRCPKKTLREFRLEDVSALNVGDVLKADVFAAGDKVDVAGVSKGKGYQGVIKRFGQHRLRESHGTGRWHVMQVLWRYSNPSRVFPGKRLPGHMGCVRVTVQNLTVVKVDTENNLIAVKGAVPGSKGTIITLANSVKA